MDNVVLAIINALSKEEQSSLEALGRFPKKDPFEHGNQVGIYQGFSQALVTVRAVLDDQVRQEVES